ncbi:MAG: hypothetical protein ACLSVD_10270 [Eggerthellaceae bacterium]
MSCVCRSGQEGARREGSCPLRAAWTTTMRSNALRVAAAQAGLPEAANMPKQPFITPLTVGCRPTCTTTALRRHE